METMDPKTTTHGDLIRVLWGRSGVCLDTYGDAYGTILERGGGVKTYQFAGTVRGVVLGPRGTTIAQAREAWLQNGDAEKDAARMAAERALHGAEAAMDAAISNLKSALEALSEA